MTIRQQIISELEKVLSELGIEDVRPVVDYPADQKHGDYASNVALVAAKKLGKNPMELAEEIKYESGIRNHESGIFEKIEIAGPGFINFWVKNETLINVIASVSEAIPDVGKGKKVVVEYSSPNIAKPFTIGHLRSTIIGDAIANLLQATGWTVYRDNHIGDWGTQFGKQIYAIKTWGNEDDIEKSDRPVKMLVDLYVKFHDQAEKDTSLEDKAREWFKKLEDGDLEAKKIWQKCIDWSWKEFEKIYEELGVTFTENNGRGYGESFFEDKMAEVIKELEDKELLKVGENGAKLVFYPPDGYPPLMIVKKDGATLYATRDLATDKFRLDKYGNDVLIINEVGAEQSLYFKQLYSLEVMLGWLDYDQRIHVKHGLYRFKEGKMSTRKGNVIWLEDVLAEAITRAFRLASISGENKGIDDFDYADKTEQEVTTELITTHFPRKKEALDASSIKAIAMGALKWNDLKRSSEQDITFDWDEILSMQGNSGPYIQYTFARTQSVLAKIKSEKLSHRDKKVQSLAEDFKLQSEERDLLKLLSRFPEIVAEAAERLSPNVLCTYLFELAQSFNLFYQKCPILKAEEEARDFRLELTAITGKTLKKGLDLLGIKAPEKM